MARNLNDLAEEILIAGLISGMEGTTEHLIHTAYTVAEEFITERERRGEEAKAEAPVVTAPEKPFWVTNLSHNGAEWVARKSNLGEQITATGRTEVQAVNALAALLRSRGVAFYPETGDRQNDGSKIE